jgi:hypothetical protein
MHSCAWMITAFSGPHSLVFDVAMAARPCTSTSTGSCQDEASDQSSCCFSAGEASSLPLKAGSYVATCVSEVQQPIQILHRGQADIADIEMSRCQQTKNIYNIYIYIYMYIRYSVRTDRRGQLWRRQRGPRPRRLRGGRKWMTTC